MFRMVNLPLRHWRAVYITGAILSDSVSSVTVNLDSASTWTLTGDSYVSAFNGDLSNVNLNGYTLYVNGAAV